MMNDRFVLITGASGGIGKACLLELVYRGFCVFAGVRQLQAGEMLKQLDPNNIIPITLDVTDLTSIKAAQEQISNRVGRQGLYGLINNAGILVSSPIECLSLDQFRAQLEVNTIGVVAATQVFLPLIRTAHGRIINLSSVSGFFAFPFMGGYCASKFALEAINNSLRQELKPWNIPVVSIQPPFVKTELWRKALAKDENSLQSLLESANSCKDLYAKTLEQQQRQALLQVEQAIMPEQVAKTVAHALTTLRPKAHYLVGRQAWLGAIAACFPDRVQDWIIRKQFGLD